MADIVPKTRRGQMMSATGMKETTPERGARGILRSLGCYYRATSRQLPGSQDLVFAAHDPARLLKLSCLTNIRISGVHTGLEEPSWTD